MKKVPTIYDVAKSAKVSDATVSRVLNNSPLVSKKTRLRVQNTIEELGYKINYTARGLSTSRTNSLSLIYRTSASALSKDTLLLEVLDGVYEETLNQGYTLSFSAIKNDNQRLIDTIQHSILHGRDDGAMVVALGIDKKLEKIIKSSPIVTIDYQYDGAACVVNDNFSAMSMAVNYLYDLGHRRIAIPVVPNEVQSRLHRYDGYKYSLMQLGIPEDPVLFIKSAMDNNGDIKSMNVSTALEEGGMDSIIVDEGMLDPLTEELTLHGIRVPDDVSIVVIQDILNNANVNNYTRVCLNWKEVGMLSVRALVNLINNPDSNRTILKVNPKFIEGLSCRDRNV